MTEARSHNASWRKFRIVRITFFVLVLGWLPYGRLISSLRAHHWPAAIGFVLVIGYVLTLVSLGCCYAVWPCPRCGRAFRGLRPYTVKYCYYCRIPNWT